MREKIVWGTCWYNESIDTLVNFLNTTCQVLNNMNFDVIPIVFDARYKHSTKDTKYLKNSIDNVIILRNNTDIFPNKNYGVSLIVRKAKNLNSRYTAIVDCDWDIKESKSFLDKTVMTLVNNYYDIVIPNIGDASGRSNLLIGNVVLNLFYPDYKDKISSAFPGSLIGLTDKLYQIVIDNDYHFDWGGEWDIISLAIKNKMRIKSVNVDVVNVRHRNNTSKMCDSFQIWKSILCNQDIDNRFKYIYNINNFNISYNKLTKQLLEADNNVLKLIKIIEDSNPSDTEKQLLYMILYPIAFLTGKIDEIPEVTNLDIDPYDKKELYKMKECAIYIAKKALLNCNTNLVRYRVKNIKCAYLSDWNLEKQKDAINNYKEV